MSEATRRLVAKVRRGARPLGDLDEDYRALVEEVGAARFVMLGEASHGTHDFYRARAEITKRLIRERGFTAVAVEADWPDALLVHHYVQGARVPRAGLRALSTFTRFPSWMWRNADMLEFVHWLRVHNQHLGPEASRSAAERDEPFTPKGPHRQRVGFFGLDLYSAAPPPGTSDETRPVDGVALHDEDLSLYREQQVRLERNSTAYFEAVHRGQAVSWNLRERHMEETMRALVAHLDKTTRRPVKMVIWEHNSHVGDARATQMGRHGELSLGQLMRERFPGETFLVGFTTYEGTVIAASGWGARAERKQVRPAHPESFEAVFHETGIPRFMISLRHGGAELLGDPRLERAIGAVYLPEAELENHYFLADLAAQFDVVVHLDETTALVPLAA